MSDQDEQSNTGQEEEVVKTALWSSKHFDRPEEWQIGLKRYSYSKGTFIPEQGPVVIANAFGNESNLTLNSVCAEIANYLKSDEEKMNKASLNPSPRTLVCAVMPTNRFDFVDEFKRQGNFY